MPDEGIYLNGARMGLLPRHTLRAGIRALLDRSQPQQITGEDFFKTVRQLKEAFARLINVSDWQRIAIIPSVSYGMANVANNAWLKPDDEVLVVAEQFPSNVYPWMRKAKVRIVPPPETYAQYSADWTTRVLEQITPQTRIVALGTVHWTDGTALDLLKIRERSREQDALLVLDGTQSVGAMPFDVAQIQPDALVLGSYKWLLGPYSLGLAYYGEAFDGGTPIEESWMNRKGAEEFAGLTNYVDAYEPKARRYDVGEQSNFQLVPMLLASLEFLEEFPPARIQEYCQQITAEPIKALQELGFQLPDRRGKHMFGLRLPQKPGKVSRVFEAVSAAGISVSLRGEVLRVAPHLYNTRQDLEELVRVIRGAL